MIYLLTLGWPWFAGAFALGALVGFLSYCVARGAVFSGGWIAALGALVLAGLAALSLTGVFEGREAAALDVTLLAGLAYAAGLPIGGVVRTFSRSAKKTPPTPLLLRGVEARIEPVSRRPVASQPAAGRSAAAARGRAKAAGAKPDTLAAPRAAGPDDLSRIRGLGPKSVAKLHALGVFHYDQIAAWSHDNALWIGAAIGAPGRIERDKWVQQARALSGAG
jgi:predicted flap endonuclease-1-like 5' DNA nuclease